ncbi:hypothetical protein BJ138DRAFT_1111455 [Hygrophoropsis aurantiaca]|uniref:Uncharacterized protein n=1 Tax=Hygrophoropsis aurantiaca TaxID=72124 RepID=A0ACB8AJG3_9AGAM|nr:hypothetical protein BJ138DRAFT_1111455 [Hygrophoropsis aurantiaca]
MPESTSTYSTSSDSGSLSDLLEIVWIDPITLKAESFSQSFSRGERVQGFTRRATTAENPTLAKKIDILKGGEYGYHLSPLAENILLHHNPLAPSRRKKRKTPSLQRIPTKAIDLSIFHPSLSLPSPPPVLTAHSSPP